MVTISTLLGRTRSRFAVLFVGALALLLTPTYALPHKDHQQREQAEQAQAVAGDVEARVQEMAHDGSTTDHAAMMRGATNETPHPLGARLIDWLGRLHPMLVHFPIAFIPAALFTAIVGRRRPGFGKPVQFLVVTGGITAFIATAAGWLGGGFALGADDWIMHTHRWLGTGIGFGASALALWALRRPEMDRSGAMIAGLSILTAAIVVQGWFGGALVHGVDHLNW